MKTISRLLFVPVFALMLSCEEYLEVPNNSLDLIEEDIFTSFLEYRNYLTTMYYDINRFAFYSDYGARNGSEKTAGFPICASDAIRSFDNYLFEDRWFNVAAFEETFCNTRRTHHTMPLWDRAWGAVRKANVVLQNIDMLQDATQEDKDRLIGQAYFGRAFAYEWMLEIWGGMPYFEKPLDIATDEINMPRLSYHETALKIAADCDSAAKYLPARWNEFSEGVYSVSENVGRYTAMHALALKSRVLLYDASDLSNTAKDPQRWKDALDASAEALNFALENGYVLMSQSEYSSLYYGEEIVKEHIHNMYYANYIRRVSDWDLAYTWLPPSITGSYSLGHGLCVTQDMVDRYEVIEYDAGGMPIRALSVEDAEVEGIYNPQDPYATRDPRFYQNIIYHGRHIDKPSRDFDMSEGSKDLEQSQGYDNKTGYYVGKYWDGGTGVAGGNNTLTKYPCVIQRVGELYLNFAEAANEVYDNPATIAEGSIFSALSAINELRGKRGTPNVDDRYTADKETFRERIRNERYVELCFEGNHSFVDSRRWKLIDQEDYRNTYKITIKPDESNDTIQYPTGYVFSKDFLEKRPYYERLYFFPIPQRDIDKASEFKQNPGY